DPPRGTRGPESLAGRRLPPPGGAGCVAPSDGGCTRGAARLRREAASGVEGQVSEGEREGPGGPLPWSESRYGISCACPGSATAPGRGRSAAESTVALKAGGMQKTLTRVEVCCA